MHVVPTAALVGRAGWRDGARYAGVNEPVDGALQTLTERFVQGA